MTSKQLLKEYLKIRTKELNRKLTDKQIDTITNRVLKRKSFPEYVGYLDGFMEEETNYLLTDY